MSKKIKQTDENGTVTYYSSIVEASQNIISNVEKWKIQLCIAEAIINKHRAFKSKWEQVK